MAHAMNFDTDRFIVEIESRECLWNTGSDTYADRDLKKKGWDELAEIFKEKDDMDIHEKKQLLESLQKRWKNIRGCYTREVNRQKSLKSGSGASRKSQYIYFKQLQFLQKVVAIRAPSPAADSEAGAGSAIAEGDEGDEEEEDNSEMYYTPSNTNQRKKRSFKRKNDTEEDVIAQVLRSSIKNREECENDSDRLFLLSLLGTLKKIPEHKKTECKITLLTALEKIKSESD